jgi:hypothetical protein
VKREPRTLKPATGNQPRAVEQVEESEGGRERERERERVSEKASNLKWSRRLRSVSERE